MGNPIVPETEKVVFLPFWRRVGLGGVQYCREVKCIVKSTHLIAEHSVIVGGTPHLISECKFTLSRDIYSLISQEIDAIMEWNDGNHFKEPDLRMAKGFSWLINS